MLKFYVEKESDLREKREKVCLVQQTNDIQSQTETMGKCCQRFRRNCLRWTKENASLIL